MKGTKNLPGPAGGGEGRGGATEEARRNHQLAYVAIFKEENRSKRETRDKTYRDQLQREQRRGLRMSAPKTLACFVTRSLRLKGNFERKKPDPAIMRSFK
jgi:hypothetical protein